MTEDQLRQINQKRKEEEQPAREVRHQKDSKRLLLKILEKKFHTSFIGAIAKFETFFGQLWGHGKDESELTPEEAMWRELWSTCRTEVLNNGNNQLRAVQTEVIQYDVTWNGYQTNLPVLPE